MSTSKLKLYSDGNPKSEKTINPKPEKTTNLIAQHSEPSSFGSNVELATMRTFQ